MEQKYNISEIPSTHKQEKHEPTKTYKENIDHFNVKLEMFETISECPITELITADEEDCQYIRQKLDSENISWECSKVTEIKKGDRGGLENQVSILRMGDHLYDYNDVSDPPFQVADSINSFFGRRRKLLPHSALTVSSIDLFGDYHKTVQDARNIPASTFSRSTYDLLSWRSSPSPFRSLGVSKFDRTRSNYDINAEMFHDRNKRLFNTFERDKVFSRVSTYSDASLRDETLSSWSSDCLINKSNITNDSELSETETIKGYEQPDETTSSEASTVILNQSEEIVHEIKPTLLPEEIVLPMNADQEEKENSSDVNTEIAYLDHHLNEAKTFNLKETDEIKPVSLVGKEAIILKNNEEILLNMTPSKELEEIPIHSYVSNVPPHLAHMKSCTILDSNELQEAIDDSEKLIIQMGEVHNSMKKEIQKYSDDQEAIYDTIVEDDGVDTIEDSGINEVSGAQCASAVDSRTSSPIKYTTTTDQITDVLAHTNNLEEQRYLETAIDSNVNNENKPLYKEIDAKTPTSADESLHYTVSNIYEKKQCKGGHTAHDIPVDVTDFTEYEEVSGIQLEKQLDQCNAENDENGNISKIQESPAAQEIMPKSKLINEEKTFPIPDKMQSNEVVRATPCEIEPNELVINKIHRYIDVELSKSSTTNMNLDNMNKFSPTANVKEESLSNILGSYRSGKPIASSTFQRLQQTYTPEDLIPSNTYSQQSPTLEYQGYEMNKYDENDTADQGTEDEYYQDQDLGKQIRRMSKNNHWQDRDDKPSKLHKTTKSISMESSFPPNCSPVATTELSQSSPTSPVEIRPVSPLTPPTITKCPKKIAAERRGRIPSPLNLEKATYYYHAIEDPKSISNAGLHHELACEVTQIMQTKSPSSVHNVGLCQIRSPASPLSPESSRDYNIPYNKGFVKERAKIFERQIEADQIFSFNKKVSKPMYTSTIENTTCNNNYKKDISEIKNTQEMPSVKPRSIKGSTKNVESDVYVMKTKNSNSDESSKKVHDLAKSFEKLSQIDAATSEEDKITSNTKCSLLGDNSKNGTNVTMCSPTVDSAKSSEKLSSSRTLHRTINTSNFIVSQIGCLNSPNEQLETQESEVTINSQTQCSTASVDINILGSKRVSTETPSSVNRVSSLQNLSKKGEAIAETNIRAEENTLALNDKSEEEAIEGNQDTSKFQHNGSVQRSRTVETYTVNLDQQKFRMPDNEFTMGANGHLRTSPEKINGEENDAVIDWDPHGLIMQLYKTSYEPRVETKRNRFVNMEGHVDVQSDETNTPAELDRNWKEVYVRTKEGRLQIYFSHYADQAPAEEIVLSGTDVDVDREKRVLNIHGGRAHVKMDIRVPSAVFDKWRQALLSHAASSQIDAYVKPIPKSFQHPTERVVIIELGSCSIRGGVLTTEPSLPQSFFPAIAVRDNDGKIIVGGDAYAPEVRRNGEFVRPIQATDPALERYSMDKKVVQACMQKVVNDLAIDPRKYKVLLSISQNIPTVLIGELLSTALNDILFQGVAITRQPSLILYAYDVTTGVVVDIGDRLSIVPVIDGYVVESAICSIPYGATQVREALRTTLCSNNKGLFSFQSPVEKLILRYVMEQTSYVPEEYSKEEQSKNKEVHVSLDAFDPTPGMPTKFNIDSSRFLCTEGLFHPKKWGLDTKGLHQLIHDAVQMSPIDSRRTLYRNIYLAGGASLLPGLAEKLEQELATIVPNTIHTQVHISPWRYNAAYLGAQIVASSSTFEDSCINQENLPMFLTQLHSSSF